MPHSPHIPYIFLLTILAFFFPSTITARQNEQKPVEEASIAYSNRIDLPPALNESSGLMWWNGKLWSHNDSSGSSNIYAFVPDNPEELEEYYAGAPNKDWEALEQDEQYIYIGDFGNNKKIQRRDLRIFRIEKESILNRQPIVDTLYFTYPEQTDLTDREKSEQTDFDCEAFIIAEDSIYLFTKQWISSGTSLYSLPKTPGNHQARYISTYHINGLATDAAYLPEKRMLALCGYSSTYLRQFIYIFYDFEGTDFFNGRKYNFTLNLGIFPHQIEGIASQDGKIYHVTNEKSPVSPQRLHSFDAGHFFEDYLLLPETPAKILGPAVVCQDMRPAVYSIPPVYQAESYEWTLPEGAEGSSSSNTITVVFDTASVSGNIAVRAKNPHGYGGTAALAIKVNEKPETPLITISRHNRSMLHSSSPEGNQWYNLDGMIKGAVSPNYEITEYGEYYVIATLSGCSSDPSNVIRAGRILYMEELPSFSTDSITSPDNADILHEYTKMKGKRKKRRFLFWEF